MSVYMCLLYVDASGTVGESAKAQRTSAEKILCESNEVDVLQEVKTLALG